MTDLKDKKIPNHLKSLWRPHPDLNGDRRFRKPYFYLTQSHFISLISIFEIGKLFHPFSSKLIGFNRIFREKLGKTIFSPFPDLIDQEFRLSLILSHFSFNQNKLNQHVIRAGALKWIALNYR